MFDRNLFYLIQMIMESRQANISDEKYMEMATERIMEQKDVHRVDAEQYLAVTLDILTMK